MGGGEGRGAPRRARDGARRAARDAAPGRDVGVAGDSGQERGIVDHAGAAGLARYHARRGGRAALRHERRASSARSRDCSRASSCRRAPGARGDDRHALPSRGQALRQGSRGGDRAGARRRASRISSRSPTRPPSCRARSSCRARTRTCTCAWACIRARPAACRRATWTNCAITPGTRAWSRSARPGSISTAITRRATRRSAGFARSCALADELGLPVVIHQRSALEARARDPRGGPARRGRRAALLR